MRFKKIIMLTIIFTCLLVVSAVSAADNTIADVVSIEETTADAISVDEADDVVSVENNQVIEQTDNEEVISEVDDGTFTSLQNKIDNAEEGSTITLENDYFYDDGFDKDGITIGKPLTINGNGHTIDGLNKSRIFNIENTYLLDIVEPIDISLNNIKFFNGNADIGGAIGFIETVPVGRTVSNDGIRLSATKITHLINNCTFINNFADNGGAISLLYGGIVRDCTFINNFADNGGAISGDDDYGSVVNCSFINNSACYGDGGAIYHCYRVMNCYFANNTALGEYYDEANIYYPGSGGAIFYVGDVENCIFVNNHADDSGGAIYNGNAVNCIFINNNAYSFGGAIEGDTRYNTYALNCRFVNNSACYGGAIERCSAVNCDFIDNYVVNTNPTKEDGCIIRIYPLSSCLPIVSYPEPGGNFHFNYEAPPDEVYTINSIMIVDCNIQENALNDYGFVRFIDGELILDSLDSDNYTILASVSGKTYVPSYEVYRFGNYVSYNAHFNLSDLSAGDYEVNIYLCNSTYVSYLRTYYNSVVNATVPINIKTKFDIFSSDISKNYGGSEKYTVNLIKEDKALANEYVQISINGKTSNVKTDSKGQASIDLNLPVGEYDVTAVYDGVSTTSKVTVKSTVTVNDATGTYLNSKVSATFLNVDGKALASKQVTFKVGDKTYTATTNSKGVATANIDLGVGPYTVTAINPVNNEQKQFKLIIDKANSAIALASNQINGVTTLTATLTPETATGNVVFNVNGEDKSASIKNGKATLTLSDLEPGDYTVTASYSGDKNLNASTSNTVSFSIAEVYPILTAEDLTKTYGNADKFVVNLIDSKGNAIANALVNVDIKGKVTPITTGSDGQATMPITLAPAEYTATVTYADMQTTAKITIKKATPKMTAKAKAFKKSVKTKKYSVILKTNKNKVMKNKKVTLKVNKKTYSAKTNSKGVATFKITKLTKKGKYTATVTYSGSSYYNKLTKKVKITVK